MPARNADIIAVFEEIADLLEIEGANPFRVRAYRNAARSVQGLGRELRTLLDEGFDATELPGIGKDLAAKIREILDTGSCKELDALHKRTPPALSILLKIPGLGPKRVAALHGALGVDTPAELERALRAGRVRDIPGFGEKTERRILEALGTHVQKKQRFQLVRAAEYAEPLVEYLKATPGVKDVIVAGSYRRCKETVGDIDVLATARRGSPVSERFLTYGQVREIVSRGSTRASAVLACGLQVDLRVVTHTSLGAALQYFTGSKAHNIAIRRLGQQRGLKINEYGVFKGERRLAGQSELSVYKSVGLAYVPPELREDRGEIEAARKGKLPKLITLRDLKGDLHAHTRASDGKATVAEMARAARASGMQYIAITDSSSGRAQSPRSEERRWRRQMEEIDRLNETLKDVRVLKGIELTILEDGHLDPAGTMLAEFDLVIGAVRDHFDLPRAKQTRRLLRAMNHPHFTILAHPGGRLLDEREACDVDMSRVIREAASRGCFLELNARPERLDLPDVQCQIARDEGVLISIASAAREPKELDYLRFGVGQARRGWLAAKDVLNARPLPELRKLLRRTMS